MQPFVFNTVRQVVCAPGAAQNLGEQCAAVGASHLLVVTDPGLMAIGLVQPVIESLAAAGFEVTLFDQVREDPPEETVLTAAAISRKAGVDGVVAVGGGSSMDVAKVVSALLAGCLLYTSDAADDRRGV